MVTAMMLVRNIVMMMMFAFAVVLVFVRVGMSVLMRPGREWIGKVLPRFRPFAHLGVA